MRQRRWLKLIKDYELEVHYHPRKANVVADALSRKAHCHCLSAIPLSESLCFEMEKLNLSIVPFGTLAHIELAPTLCDLIITAQKKDKGMKEIERRILAEDPKIQCFHQDSKGVLWFDNRIVVPKDFELRKQILDEAHTSRLSIHPGSNKMYQDLKQRFWWTRMKREIARCVAAWT